LVDKHIYILSSMLRHFRFILLPIFIGVAKQSQLAKMAATHFRWFAEPRTR